jgi:hypothetical protein
MKSLVSIILLIVFTAISGFSIGGSQSTNDLYKEDAIKKSISNIASVFHLEEKNVEENENKFHHNLVTLVFSILNLILLSKLFYLSLRRVHFQTALCYSTTRKAPRISYLPPPRL